MPAETLPQEVSKIALNVTGGDFYSKKKQYLQFFLNNNFILGQEKILWGLWGQVKLLKKKIIL